jgi:Carbohydrate esterase, sialic acid-specific acetylesterase
MVSNRIRNAITRLLIWITLVASKSVSAKRGNRPVVRVFIVAGEANVAGYASTAHLHQLVTGRADGNNGKDIAQTEKHNLPYQHLWNASNSSWIIRNDVFVAYDHVRSQELLHGPLTAGGPFGAKPNTFGPELQMGHVLGKVYDEPVVIIKAGWEDRSLWKDFASPSTSNAAPGFQWLRMIKNIHQVGNSLHEILGDSVYKYSQIKLGGVVWWHGYTDFKNNRMRDEYGNNLVKFIKDIRVELKQPDLPVVVGELGGQGWRTKDMKELEFRQMQEQTINENFPNDNVVFVQTAVHVKTSPAIQNYTHYFGNAPTMIDISQAFAAELISMNEDADWVVRASEFYISNVNDFDDALYIRFVCMAIAITFVGASVAIFRGDLRRTWNNTVTCLRL